MKTLIENIKKSLRRKEMKVYGSVTREVLPVFHNKYKTMNRDFERISIDNANIDGLQLESQNSIPIHFSTDFMVHGSQGFQKHYADKEFEVNGIKEGMELYITGEGFLENIETLYTVVLVSDKFIYLKNGESFIKLISHSELKEIEKKGGLI